MDDSIDKALEQIGQFFKADRSYIFMFSLDGSTINNTHEWCADGVAPQIERMRYFPVESLPWWTNQIRKKQTIEIFDVELLPEEARAEREEFRYQGIKSILSVPMVNDGLLFGFLGIDHVREKRSWSPQHLSSIRILTEIIANILTKKKSENEKDLILNSISESVSFLDIHLRLIWANQVMADSIGKNLEDMYGRHCYQLTNDLDEPCPDCPAQKVFKSKKIEEDIVITKKGRIRNVRCYPVVNCQNEITGIVKVASDITDQRQMENNLLDSENRFRQLVELAPDAILVQVNKHLRYVNQAALELFGARHEGELIGKPVIELLHPDYRKLAGQMMESLINKEQVPRLEEVYIKLDGTPVDVEVEAVPIRFENQDGSLVYVRDISQRKRAERQRANEQAALRQQQKLEAIGVLASGVAHEINNPINGIMNYAQLILDNACDCTGNVEYASEIIKETERVSNIVSNLLRFSRQEKQSHSPARIEDIIERTLSLIRTLFRRDQIRLDLDMPENLPSIKCRSQQIEQVFMNLMTNARDALNMKYPDYHEDKVIKVGCSLFERDERSWLRITVEDKGPGIPTDNYDKIFEPFFTSKPRDIGTGLGLSISYGIIKDHQGEISFDTELGEYTRFHVDLPVNNGWDLENKEEV